MLVCFAGFGGATACSSQPEKPDEGAQARKKVSEPGEPLDLDKPTTEELGDSPCGNPDWARPPNSMAGQSDIQGRETDAGAPDGG